MYQVIKLYEVISYLNFHVYFGHPYVPTENLTISDCSAPFRVGIVTDATADKQDTNTGAMNTQISRGK